ncbi:MAG: hypothetical protein A2W22_04910 [Candidatus Levybacteria bacterium RBG_16_35_11]|nr:MAG: hypothetical protein A2W22_04910 [Candidatus Levybacteria bacterium RBG_16_35_11]
MKSNVFVLVILFIVALFAFYNVGGIFPEKLNTTGSQGGSYVMVTPVPGSSSQSLQLNFVKFKGCSSTTAVDFLVDRSGSMEGQKLTLLKQGILSFASKLSDQSVFGLQTFADPPNIVWKNDINPDLFSNVKSNITNVVCSLQANGATHTKDAFEQTKAVLADTQKRFSERQLAFIFVSDGIPETGTRNNLCRLQGKTELCNSSCRCFDPAQDPTQIAEQIKAMGIKIYSIGYVDKNDDFATNQLKGLMERVASSPDKAHMAPNEAEVIKILNDIGYEICSK